MNVFDADNEAGLDDGELDFYSGGLFTLAGCPASRLLESMAVKHRTKPAVISRTRNLLQVVYDALVGTAGLESQLRRVVSQARHEVSQQRVALDKQGLKQFSDNSQRGDLRRQLTKEQNDLEIARGHNARLRGVLDELTLQRSNLEADVGNIRQHKVDLLEPQLTSAIRELKLEISQLKNQTEILRRDEEEKAATLQIVQQQTVEIEAERESLSTGLTKSLEMPVAIRRHADQLREAISTLIAENSRLTVSHGQYQNQAETLMRRRSDLEHLQSERVAEVLHMQTDLAELEKVCDELFREQESSRDEFGIQKAEQVRIEIEYKQTVDSSRMEHEMLVHTLRDKEAHIKANRRLETIVNNVVMSIPTFDQQHMDYSLQLESLKRSEREYRKQAQLLRKEIDTTLAAYLEESTREGVLNQTLESMLSRSSNLEESLRQLELKFQERQQHLSSVKVDAELRFREVVRSEAKVRGLSESISAQEILLKDAVKRANEAAQQLKDFAALYQVVKNERNRYLNMIQSSAQRSAEMKEKIKILANEIEILQQALADRMRELAGQTQSNAATLSLRDQTKNEANKLLAVYRERRAEMNHSLSRIATHNHAIGMAEQLLVVLQDRHVQARRERDGLAKDLITYNEELCVMYERLNTLKKVSNDMARHLNDRNDELRKVQLMQAETQRRVNLLANGEVVHHVETTRQYEQKCEQLEKMKKLVSELGESMENPKNPNRCRILGGTVPDYASLLKKVHALEHRLGLKEEQWQEKRLVLDEVTLLTQRLQQSTAGTRDETNTMHIRHVELVRRLNRVDRQLKAKRSEATMYRRQAEERAVVRSERQALVEGLSSRDSQGSILPTPVMERHYLRLEQQRIQRQQNQAELMHRAELARQLAGGAMLDADPNSPPAFFISADGSVFRHGKYTTAEIRPNAYLPDAGTNELPVPRPYGVHAPFKAASSSITTRYWRKPAAQEVIL
ncbi:hypothetical protein CXG81DRAFT_16070 [Caulochytrium protostelioides]|uniref:Uncharacterized protein n=1 Tax=Caulochytrium protostelioides TaxID=1555241 RepID=A0A4P9WUU2_9FUNG|nr:hypothetical protein CAUPRSCDRAFT_7099 [Caulochytrium protostelioides]RKO98325.1 hypothetical protein CXG81DRAFT_16070 [Caulochytrium protostelioides]|eukprot:RKO98325.1 hypothetical protein CXG81DRAFT_16070 [Caulochytrium protostelioides]